MSESPPSHNHYVNIDETSQHSSNDHSKTATQVTHLVDSTSSFSSTLNETKKRSIINVTSSSSTKRAKSTKKPTIDEVEVCLLERLSLRF